MYGNRPGFRQPIGMGGAAGPPPSDILWLLGILFVTYSLQFFQATAGIGWLFQLSRSVWQRGFLWQLGTYPFVAEKNAGGLWFLLSLLIIFWFGRDVYRYLGRRRFWLLMAWAVGTSSVVAVAVQLLLDAAGAGVPHAFVLMQGQTMVLTVLIAAFATVYGNATILLFFVLPLKARWFLGLEILFAFMGFLTTKDFAGFIGICAAVGLVYQTLTGGGLRRLIREGRLRLEQKILELRLRRMRGRRGMKIVKPPPDDEPRGPWIH